MSLCPPSLVSVPVSLSISLFLCRFLCFSLSVILTSVCVWALCVFIFSVSLCLHLSLCVPASLLLCLYLSLSLSLCLFFCYLCLFTSLPPSLFVSVSVSLGFTSCPSPATTTRHMWAEGLSPFPPISSPLAAAHSFPILASPARPSWALGEGGERGREGSLAGPPLFAFPGWEAGPVGLLTSPGRLCRTPALDAVPGPCGPGSRQPGQHAAAAPTRAPGPCG